MLALDGDNLRFHQLEGIFRSRIPKGAPCDTPENREIIILDPVKQLGKLFWENSGVSTVF